jgi:glycine cleavage system pyridoxal-binding protein P
MSDEPKSVSDLRVVRAALVEERRAFATAAVRLRDKHRDAGEDATVSASIKASNIAALQTKIEAIDGAIQDEEALTEERGATQ